jgi:hypothetical protein
MFIKKVLFVLLLIFFSRLFFSCCNCPDDLTSVNLNSVKIQNIDNNFQYGYSQTTLKDSMLRAVVAFEVNVIDSTVTETHWFYGAIPGFTSASAFQPCECPQLFQPVQSISEIKIITLKDINAQIKAGADVTDLFVGTPTDTFLYTPLKKLLDKLKGSIASGIAGYSISIFCKEQIDNDTAQFEVLIGLSDSRILKAKTQVIHLSSPQL